MNQRILSLKDLTGLGPMSEALLGLLLCSGFFLAPTRLLANSLHPCGSIRIANTTFCFLDANGDGRYQEAEEEFCLDGWLTRGGIRCRGEGGESMPGSHASVLTFDVLTSGVEACPGSRSVEPINAYLRNGYRISGGTTETQMHSSADGVMRCGYTRYSLKKR